MAKGGARLGATAASSSSSMDDSSPYLLTNGDHPGMILVSHPLNGNNFNTWSRAMVMALTAKNKFGFVDGSIPPPNSDDLLFNTWVRCNSMAISWILNSVSKDIADSLLYMDTAAAIWTDLRDCFHQSNGPRLFQIKQNFIALNQGSMDVNSYFTWLKTLWAEYMDFQPVPACSCGAMHTCLAYQQQDYVIQFLMGLNDSYTQIQAQILMYDPLPPISKVFALIVQEERQRSITHGYSSTSDSLNLGDSSLLPAANSVAAPPSKGRRERPLCSQCGIQGHTVEKCYKLHGYPPGYKFKTKSPSASSPWPLANSIASDASGSADSALSVLTPAQCQQLIALLSSQLQTGSTNSPVTPELQPPGPFVSNIHGPYSGHDDWDG